VEDGFSPAVMSVAIEELDGLLKLRDRNVRKTARARLIWNVFDFVPRERSPVTDPDPAERAIAVEDENGSLEVDRHFLD
jgi:hypothetical protein